jgi:Mrp family chromosome partitioning ATPase/capsular polysaccharide biosynthesis protein
MNTRTLETPSLQHYLHVFKRRKWILLQAALLVPLAAVLFSLHQQHRYRATAEVWVNGRDFSAFVTGVGTGYAPPDRVLATSADLARVPTVAAAALKLAHRTDRTPGDLLANSTVDPKSDADLLEFKVTDAVPAIGARLATSYARAYITYRHLLDTQQLKRLEAQVASQIKQLEAIGQTRSALYLTLVQKLQQLQAVEALLTPPILTRPASGATQVQPQPVRNGLLGFLIGLGLGLGLAFLRDALDTRVRSADEIADRIGLPLLARLPEPPARMRNESKLSMMEEPDGIHAEAFRVLRTNLEFVNLERRAQIIMVTSALEGEGKSTTVANLAVAFARAGRRVVAVDLDLRRPWLDKLLGVGKRAGLTQVAIGQLSLEDALVPIPFPDPRARSLAALTNGGNASDLEGSLEILPAGPVPPDVGEFVGSRALLEIFEQLRHMADIVLVDSPPLLRVGDAMTLSGKVDGVLVVSRLDSARRPLLTELNRVLESCPAERLGFVLTGAELESGYGYGYGYGYGHTYAPSREPRTEAVPS